jgi:hypothetical protein
VLVLEFKFKANDKQSQFVVGGYCPSLFIHHFNDAPFRVFVFALAAGPSLLPFAVKLILFVLAVVVAFFELVLANRPFAVWLQGELGIIGHCGVVQFLLDKSSNDSVNCLFCCSWHFVGNFLGQSSS